MYVYHFNDINPDKYLKELKSGDETIYCSHLDQDGIDDFIHIHSCGVHFLSEFDTEFDRKNIKHTLMGYLKSSDNKICVFKMENGKKWLISPVKCEDLEQLPYDPFYDKGRNPSDEGYLSYKKAYQSACTIYS